MYQGHHPSRTVEMHTSSAGDANVLQAIQNRRSVRRYLTTMPDRLEIDRIIEHARYAPSAHNAQPWRFHVIVDGKKKRELIDKMAARFRSDLTKDKVPEETIRKKTERSVRLFSEAPVIIIACIDMSLMHKYPDPARQQAETTMATQSLAAGIQNLLLAAQAVNLSGCWYCAPLFCPDVVQSVLRLTDGHIPQALITIGYPAETPTTPPRLQLDEIRFTA